MDLRLAEMARRACCKASSDGTKRRAAHRNLRQEGSYSIAVRMYLPRTQMNNLLTLLSALSRTGILTGFTYVLLDPMTIRTQTFAYKFYEDDTGWRYDNMEYFEELRKVSSAFDREDGMQVTFQNAPVPTFQ